ncbi:hypothetical protein [Siminovitchia fordii]|uniref:hypothetical protein n=1 Tax=Siminovitchia fordii TaxID=254759 RepID=UPI0003A110C6|nr:hypothetical protein [Siminovitchia fordii]
MVKKREDIKVDVPQTQVRSVKAEAPKIIKDAWLNNIALVITEAQQSKILSCFIN